MKKLTIIIPCFNMEKYILNALNSIKVQESQEVICDVYVIDDGSKDSSCNIVKKFIKDNNLNNFHLIEKENGNWGSVINYAKNKLNIQTNYITILDADDYYHDDLFHKISNLLDKDYDMVFTGFYEIKKKIKNGYLTPQKGNKVIERKYMYFPSLIPLCKFFKTSIFKNLNDLEEKISYQDIILWNSFIDKAQSFYYVKKNYGYYLNHREGASSTQPFNEKRIEIMMNIINNLISENKYKNGYLMALLMHLKKNTPKENRKFIKLNGDFKNIKKFKLLWCPLGTRIITKIGMRIYLFKLLKNGHL